MDPIQMMSFLDNRKVIAAQADVTVSLYTGMSKDMALDAKLARLAKWQAMYRAESQAGTLELDTTGNPVSLPVFIESLKSLLDTV